MIDHIFFECINEGKEISEIAAVRTNRKGQHVEGYSEKIQTKHLEGVPLEESLKDLKEQILNSKYADDYVLVTLKAIKNSQIENLFSGTRIHLVQLAWPLAFGGMIPSLSLDSISKYHGVVNKKPGEAKGNVVAILETYWQMMRRYKTALSAEEGLRAVGGDALEGLRRSLGF